jgi:putative ABC transport system permease protein
LKAVVSDRYDMLGQMPLSYVTPLSQGAAQTTDDKVPVDSMSWQFYLGTVDARNRTRESLVPLIATETRCIPAKVGKKVTHKGMIDDIDPVDQELIDKLADKTDGCLMGRKRMQTLNKRVGERFRLTGSQPAGVNLDFEIVGTLPPGRWDDIGVMNARYLNAAIDKFCRDNPASKAALDRRIDIFWLQASNKEDFPRIVEQVNKSPLFTEPTVRCESYASLVANFINAYSGFIWFIEWVLVPGSIFSMALLIANAISLNVRERTKELAILKVIGFRPGHLVVLVLGEALLLGSVSGLVAGGLIYWIINTFFSGVVLAGSDPMPVPWQAILWGGSVGGATSMVGSILPAWTASTIEATRVFARVG